MVAAARFGGSWATDLREVTADLSRLDTSGRWAVALPYAGTPVCARFASWTEREAAGVRGQWTGPEASAWTSSLNRDGYVAAVARIRSAIAAGDVYQANVCRVMSAALPEPDRADVGALHEILVDGNPAPFGGFLRLPQEGVHIVSASPELFLAIRNRHGRRIVRSGPIKGTGRTTEDLADKDAAENVMIVDLVRNDLSIVSETGSVTVPRLLEVQQHPGLVHLVSYVQGDLRAAIGWTELLQATFPPGSVTGAPKIAAVQLIDEVERAARSYYCGAFGWVDADTGEAELAVSIRTFWHDTRTLHFGTGAGITWGSDANAEWRETELKAERLIGLAGSAWQADPS